MVEIVRMDRQDFAALLLGAAARWLSPAATAAHGGRVTLLVANPPFDDAAYAQAVVVLQPGESGRGGVMLTAPASPSSPCGGRASSPRSSSAACGSSSRCRRIQCSADPNPPLVNSLPPSQGGESVLHAVLPRARWGAGPRCRRPKPSSPRELLGELARADLAAVDVAHRVHRHAFGGAGAFQFERVGDAVWTSPSLSSADADAAHQPGLGATPFDSESAT